MDIFTVKGCCNTGENRSWFGQVHINLETISAVAVKEDGFLCTVFMEGGVRVEFDTRDDYTLLMDRMANQSEGD